MLSAIWQPFCLSLNVLMAHWHHTCWLIDHNIGSGTCWRGTSNIVHCCKSQLPSALTHWGRDRMAVISDDIFKCIFLNENVWISIKISLKFVPKASIVNIPALAQIMAWGRTGDKPLSEPKMVSLLMHICVTRPQWVKGLASELRDRHSEYSFKASGLTE